MAVCIVCRGEKLPILRGSGVYADYGVCSDCLRSFLPIFDTPHVRGSFRPSRSEGTGPYSKVCGRPGTEEKMTQPTVLDLFCGAGGSALGFLKAGFRIVGAADIDPDACATYAELVGVVPLCIDLSRLLPREASRLWNLGPGDADVLLGCPPCQGFTRMRNGDGRRDLRNRLIFTFLEYLRYFRPRFVVFENVPGLIRTSHGRPYYRILFGGMEELGYRIRSEEVDAADYGTPQHRRRVLVIGGLNEDPPFPEPTHGAPDHPDVRAGRLRPWVTVREAIGYLRPLKAGEADPEDPMHRAPRMGRRVAEFISRVPKDGGSRTDVPREYWLPCHLRHDGHKDVYGRLAWDRPSVVITSGCCNVSKGRFVHPEQDRAITPREAALLQGFPPGVMFYGSLESIRRQIGNAVPPPLAEAVARAIMARLSSPRSARRHRSRVGDTPRIVASGDGKPYARSRAGPPPRGRQRKATAKAEVL